MTPHQVFVVTGGTGSSGELLARTALAQFPDHRVAVDVIGGVRSRDELIRAVEAAQAAGAVVVHTLVEAELRRELAGMADERRLIAVDAMGPVEESAGEVIALIIAVA